MVCVYFVLPDNSILANPSIHHHMPGQLIVTGGFFEVHCLASAIAYDLRSGKGDADGNANAKQQQQQRWRQLAPMPEPRAFAASAVLGGRMVVVGGSAMAGGGLGVAGWEF